MWWAIFFAVVTLTLLAVAGTLAVLTEAYSKALEAYRLAKLTLEGGFDLGSGPALVHLSGVLSPSVYSPVSVPVYVPLPVKWSYTRVTAVK